MRVESYALEPSTEVRKFSSGGLEEIGVGQCDTSAVSAIRSTAKKVVAHSVQTSTIRVLFNSREIMRRKNFAANQTFEIEGPSSCGSE